MAQKSLNGGFPIDSRNKIGVQAGRSFWGMGAFVLASRQALAFADGLAGWSILLIVVKVVGSQIEILPYKMSFTLVVIGSGWIW